MPPPKYRHTTTRSKLSGLPTVMASSIVVIMQVHFVIICNSIVGKFPCIIATVYFNTM
ncbi:hypothetical protein M6B38_415915 [Iris pallida]|uniref:Uncharacterized protein n=1 Tax=Iris pallida TaxID=29817 RepID=A0AAX6FLI9_IRIPA|nr:hypothetical protein M6B38_415915 [Iris pallida]